MEVGTAETSPTSAELKQNYEALVLDIRAAMEAGNDHEVIRIQQLLRELPQRILAAETKEIRAELDQIEANLVKLRGEEKELQQLKRERNQIVGGLLHKLRDAQEDVERVQFALTINESERVDVRERKKTLTTRQKELMDKIQEVTKDELKQINGS